MSDISKALGSMPRIEKKLLSVLVHEYVSALRWKKEENQKFKVTLSYTSESPPPKRERQDGTLLLRMVERNRVVYGGKRKVRRGRHCSVALRMRSQSMSAAVL